jgi:hypothetical protein
MIMNQPERISIRFDDWYGGLSTVLGLPPSKSYVEIDGDMVHVRMGWAFRSKFPIAAIVSAKETNENPMSRGVHGFAGRWLVNGSGQGILAIELNPSQRGYVLGFPVRLRQLKVSVSEPAGLAALLKKGS